MFKVKCSVFAHQFSGIAISEKNVHYHRFLIKLAGLNLLCIVHVKSSVVVKVCIQLYLNVFKILLFDYACMYRTTSPYPSLKHVI